MVAEVLQRAELDLAGQREELTRRHNAEAHRLEVEAVRVGVEGGRGGRGVVDGRLHQAEHPREGLLVLVRLDALPVPRALTSA